MVLATGSFAHAESPVRLRIVSWNVWGVPAITTRLDERMAALPDAVAGLEPDIVCFQELWEARHAESVSKRLGERGFREFRRFEAPAGLTGLFVASKLPLSGGTFRRFSIGRMPHSFWHLDWMVEKGVADVSVLTAVGELRIENTHLQAQYRTDRYAADRLAQAAELVLGNRERASEPLIVVGDFNGSGDELPRRVLRDLGALEDTNPSSSEDSVYVRGNRHTSIRVVSVKSVLGEAVPLGNGSKEPLSDHAALLVELELGRCTDCRSERRVASATRAAAIESLERAADSTPFRVVLALLTALALLVLSVSWRRRLGRLTAGRRLRVFVRLLAFALLGAAFVWTSYLGVYYYPTRSKVLRQIADQLESEGSVGL